MLRRLAAILTILALVQLTLTASDASCVGHEGGGPGVATTVAAGVVDHALSRPDAHGAASLPDGCAPSSAPARCTAMPACAANALTSPTWTAVAVAAHAFAAFPAAPLAPSSPVRAPELPPPRA
ncbi:MAG TPA: hypothetical protein VK922_00380 [Gemmatimonadaceae bacterium]|nr:hypothetical protein [Gemmatimonadaceae bacterium]